MIAIIFMNATGGASASHWPPQSMDALAARLPQISAMTPPAAYDFSRF